jgi:hypothetical protein
MGFFDSVKDKAGALAADAERAGKVTAAQARLVVLQSDLKKAERELGHAAFSLIERGDPVHPELAHVIERVRATAAEVRAKEREIAELRGETPVATPAGTASGTTPEATGPAADVRSAVVEAITEADSEHAPAPQPTATTVQTSGGPVIVQPAEVMAAAEAEAALGAEVMAAAEAEAASSPPRKTTRRKTTANPSPTGKAPAKKPAAKKTPAGKPAKAGSTPKKTSRPASAGPRPAGKKRPADT